MTPPPLKWKRGAVQELTFARWLRLPVVGDLDELSKANLVVPAERSQVNEELLLAEFAIGEQGHVDVFGQYLVEPLHDSSFVVVAPILQLGPQDGLPDEWRRTTMGGDEMKRNR